MSSNKLGPFHIMKQYGTTDKYLLKKILKDVIKSEKPGCNIMCDYSYIKCVCVNAFWNNDWEKKCL